MEPASFIGIGVVSHGPWPLWRIQADACPCKPWPADDLSSYYASLTGPEECAARLLCEAEGHLNEDEDDESAMEKALAAVRAFKELDNLRGAADALRVVIHVHRAQCHAQGYSKRFGYKHDIRDAMRDAEELAKKELKAFRTADHKRGEAAMLLSLAEICFECGNQQEALVLAADARGKFHEVSDAKMEAVALLALSNMHFRGSDAKNSLHCAKEAHSIFIELCDKRGEAKALHASALAYVLDFNVKAGVEIANEALVIFRELQLQRLEAMELLMVAKWQLACERYREALPAAKEALSLFEDTSYGKGWQASALRTVVDVYLARHETAGALRAVLRVLERCQEQNDGKTATLAQDAMVHVRLARNELPEAAAACDEAWAGVQNDSRDKEVTALVMETWAKVIYRCAGDAGETFRTYKEAARIAEEAGNLAMQVSCYHSAWQHCMLIRDPGGAKEVAGSLRDVCRKCQWSIGDATGKLCFARAFALTGA